MKEENNGVTCWDEKELEGEAHANDPLEYIDELYEYIKETPRLLSLLYDIDLLPEQTIDKPEHHIKTLRIAQAWRDNNKEVKK
jgi:hypothetical protein